jgi:hypothetical protein
MKRLSIIGILFLIGTIIALAVPPKVVRSFFDGIGYPVEIYVPHRHNEGYGLHNHALDALKEKGVTLVITVDLAITNIEEVAYAKVVQQQPAQPPVVIGGTGKYGRFQLDTTCGHCKSEIKTSLQGSISIA